MKSIEYSRRDALGLIAASMVAVPGGAIASDGWPNRTIRLVVPAIASPTDVHGRLFAEMLGERIGQRLLVDNKPGGSGNIGMQAAAAAAPDGYTFAFAIASYITSNPFMFKKLLYDTERDFEPVAMLSKAGFTFVVRDGLGVQTLAELTAYIKSNPGKLTAGNLAPGSLLQISWDAYVRAIGGSVELISYKGTAQVLQDLWGGQLDVCALPIGSTRQFEGNGKTKAVAITTIERHPGLPEVPTLAEQGFSGFDYYGWYAIFAPKKTPADIIVRMNREANALISSKEYKDKMISLGAVAFEPMSPEEFRALYLKELAMVGPIIKNLNLVVE